MKTTKKKLTKAQNGIVAGVPVKKVEYKSGNKTSFVQKDNKGTAVSTYKTAKPVNKSEVSKTGTIDPKTNTVSSSKQYKAGSYGNTPKYKVTSYSDNKPTSVYKKEMDTTGYAAGKPTFTVNTYNSTAGKPTTKTSKTVNRSQAKSLLKNMESSARKGKKGGTVAKLPKAQNGGIMGFGSLGKTKNTLSQKDMDKMRKEGAAQAKRNKEANKKFNADIKSGKIKLAGVSKNKK